MKQKVYLAGGMHSEWRHDVKQLEGFKFFDPMGYNDSLYEYGRRDLLAVKECDILFLYIDKDNPSGYGACVEAGYAKALGKTVISVLDRKHPKHDYIQFVGIVSDVVYYDLDKAIDYLATLDIWKSTTSI